MSVKKKDRHTSRSECLNRSRVLTQYAMILTRPKITNDDGSKVKAGILGEGQPYYAFGIELFDLVKKIHAKCYKATEIYIKNSEDLEARNLLFEEALEFCDNILYIMDLCIFMYARNNQKKMNSFVYLCKLTKEVKTSIKNRMNLDKMILQNIQKKSKKR